VCRVAIIGTGALGACVGYYLAREGADVVLVDAGQPGARTTGASLAWVNASSKADNRAYFDLNFAGLREHQRLAAELADGAWWNQTGHLRCYERVAIPRSHGKSSGRSSCSSHTLCLTHRSRG
jgi:glycine/D-amino acid oxidase-like deaminating enzyme